MSNKDLRKEQVKLLRFEKILKTAGAEKAKTGSLDRKTVLAALPLVAAASAAAATKLGSDTPLHYLSHVKSAATSAGSDEAWLMQLAEVVSKGHNAIEAMAQQGAFMLLQAGGTPKEPPNEVIASLLLNGPL